MINAAFKALNNVLSPPFRGVLWKALGLTLMLFVGLLAATQALLWWLTELPWPWLEAILAVVAGLGLIAAFIFLMAPVTALFAGLFLDDIAEIVEAENYPGDPPGRPLNTTAALWTGIQFALLVLLVYMLMLPFLFFGIGAAVMIIGNAYLLSREYFGMIARRHHSARDAATLRKANAGRIWAAGFVPAGLSLLPLANLLVPLFATAYFVHIYKRVAREG